MDKSHNLCSSGKGHLFLTFLKFHFYSMIFPKRHSSNLKVSVINYMLVTFKILSLAQTFPLNNKPTYPNCLPDTYTWLFQGTSSSVYPKLNSLPSPYFPCLDLFPVFPISVNDIISNSVVQVIKIESSLILLPPFLPYTDWYPSIICHQVIYSFLSKEKYGK